jgi:pyruvate/2-oxoglutarate dehydrogenase complex dihydrolipoamide acyltransferase (E2) component
MADITLPQLGETVTEGTITRWFKKVGDTIAADEPLFEVSTDKVDTEVPSPVAGTLTEIRVAEGETVAVGTVIAVVGAAGAAPAPAPEAPDSTKCCFFNTFKSHWQPNLPTLGCDADPSGLRTCLSGKILNDTDDMR